MRVRQDHRQDMLHDRAAAVVADIAYRDRVVACGIQVHIVGAGGRDAHEPQLRIGLDQLAADTQLVGQHNVRASHPRRDVGIRRDIMQHHVREYALERAHVKIAIADGGEIKEYGFDGHDPHYTGMLRTVLMLAASLRACAAGIDVVDDTGAHLNLAQPARRIVSLAPGATEMLFAAGAGAQLVATVAYSDQPAAARRVPRIGDSSAIDMERLLVLKPDVIVYWPGGNNPAQVAQLKRLGFVLYGQQVNRLGDLGGSLRRLGLMAGTSASGATACRADRRAAGAIARAVFKALRQ